MKDWEIVIEHTGENDDALLEVIHTIMGSIINEEIVQVE